MQDSGNVIDNEIEPKRRRAGSGWEWISEAFMLYLRAPLQWTLIGLAATILCLLVSSVPVVGWVLGTLLLPLMLGGVMQAAQKAVAGQPPQLKALFWAFSMPGELLKVGIFYIAGVLAVVVLLACFMYVSFELGLMPKPSPELLKERGLLSMWPFLLMFFSSLAMVYSAYFFAPTLVVLHNLSARDALRLSFLGFWRNWLPLLVMGLIGIMLLTLAIIPFMLGLLVAVPVMLLVSYTSYVDIYED
ncbi:MAG: BPSS1780 family membrane protein [Formivibrio sp.]|nr:BPSS1780 family membrane protein [Formivibrio sp.]